MFLAQSVFAMENALVVFENGYLPEIIMILLDFHLWEPGGFPGGKIHNTVGIAIKLQPQDFNTLIGDHSLPSAICQSYHLYVPTSLWLQWLPLQVIWSNLGSHYLYSPISPDFGVAICPYNLNYLRDLRKCVVFTFFSFM